MPSFSSSLLDAIYNSLDESKGLNDQQEANDLALQRKINAARVEEEIESLRRAIMVEKWMENYRAKSTTKHMSSNSGSSNDSSFFSAAENESLASKSTPRSSIFAKQKSKSKGLVKIYGELKKAKDQPVSPGGKIANFLNSIFSSRNLKKNQGLEEWNLKKNQGLEEFHSVRKSRSMNDTSTSSLVSRSCLSKNPGSKGTKSKRVVRFCPLNVIFEQDCPNKRIIKKNEGNNNLRKLYDIQSDFDDKSCASSDLFELENIERVGVGSYEEELPVYGTTRFRII